MKRPAPWVWAAAAGAAFLGAMIFHRSWARPGLPPLVHYDRLPPLFGRRLTAARAGAEAGTPDALRRLAQLYEANRLYPEARACFRTMAAGFRLTGPDHYDLALMAQDENNLEEAGREFRAALRQAPDYLPAHLALAEVLLKSGQADAAAAEYQTVLGRQPGQSQADFGLARIELQQGQDDAAVSRLEDLLARHPEATGAAALLGGIMDRRGEARRAAALAQWSRQRPEPAAPDPWSAALDADCCDCQRLELEAEQDLNSGELSSALPLLDRVAELDPSSWIPQLLRGWSAFQAGRFGEAVAEYRNALQRGGDPEMICPQVVNALLNQDKYDEAAAFIGGYRAGRPDSIPLLTAAAEVAVRRGDRAAARALLGQVLAREPYLYPQAMQLIRLLWSEGRRAEAVPYLERLVEVRPLDVDAQGLLAQDCLDRGAPAEAAAHLEPVLAFANIPAAMRGPMEQMLAVACLEQGDALAAGGDAAGARRQWLRARSLAAGSGEIATEAARRLGPGSP